MRRQPRLEARIYNAARNPPASGEIIRRIDGGGPPFSTASVNARRRGFQASAPRRLGTQACGALSDFESPHDSDGRAFTPRRRRIVRGFAAQISFAARNDSAENAAAAFLPRRLKAAAGMLHCQASDSMRRREIDGRLTAGRIRQPLSSGRPN